MHECDWTGYYTEHRQNLRKKFSAFLKFYQPIYEKTEEEQFKWLASEISALTKKNHFSDKSQYREVPFIGIAGYRMSGKTWFA